MRKICMAGNWKMNTTTEEALALAQGIRDQIKDLELGSTQVVICPPAIHLAVISNEIAGSQVKVGAQNMHFADSGAYTGELSPAMVKEWCDYIIIGHSERREYFAETDQTVNKKIAKALEVGLIPIVCVGESLEIRERGDYLAYVEAQVKAAFAEIKLDSPDSVVIAYEPIWAIGTGKVASNEQAQEVIGHIRTVLAGIYSPQLADGIIIQYGGSAKPDNIAGIMAEKDIDGALIGGASLKVDSFVEMVKNATQA